MKFLIPLGLLGLLGIVALIIIYLIKPNYQQKLISSTFIWKLSLKLKKRRIPISKLRSILLIVCQILIVTLASLILANTVFVYKDEITQPEVVLIVDSSASMRTSNGDDTRYERAVQAAIEQAEAAFATDGIVSVIIADNTNSFFAERLDSSYSDQVIGDLHALIDEDKCSYSTSDMQAALDLSDKVMSINPAAKIFVYTDAEYPNVSENITLVNVADSTEWNAAILDARAEYEDNYYTFYVDVASYGRDIELEVSLTVFGLNAIDSEDATNDTITLKQTVSCTSDETHTIVFKYFMDDVDGSTEASKAFEESMPDNYTLYVMNTEERVFSYNSVNISINEDDSLSLDNSFNIYDGIKELIKIQYYSYGVNDSGTAIGSNPFVESALAALKSNNTKNWDIQVTKVKMGSEPATKGFDFYIFEHTMPEKLPTDGIVLLIDPLSAPVGSGISIDEIVSFGKNLVYLAPETDHPILDNIDPTRISVSRYNKVNYDSSYTVLMSYAGDPMLLVKNDEEARVGVICFSLHYSNLALTVDFPLMICNMFDYFNPTTVEKSSFETNETIKINSRSDAISVKGYETNLELTSFPTELTMTVPGSYELSQITYSGKMVYNTIYVRTPAEESHINTVGGSLESPDRQIDESDFYNDLLLYLACALVALILLEWYLNHRETSV